MDTCFILSIDQGTTTSKAALIDSHGEVLRASSKPVQVTFPQPGWVEQDPFDLWNSAREAAAEVLEGIEPAKLVAVAVTNQRESTLIWERATGQPLGPCVTWQCQRSADF